MPRGVALASLGLVGGGGLGRVSLGLIGGSSGSTPTPAAAALPFWWTRLSSQHRVDLWQKVPDGPPGSHGNVPGFSWALRYRDIRAFHEVKPSSSDVTDIGSLEQDIVVTRDVFWLGVHQEVNEGWLLVDVTLNAAGDRSDNWGFCWAARGVATSWPHMPGMPMGHREIRASLQPSLPDSVRPTYF